jgi:7,8-dihydropterin-6-yl-methyl-4-(beta-D-ribofuranosyl)aminobenzene 5'-phosphate synthase
VSIDVPVLDELDLVVVVDNETDALSSVDDGVPQISERVSLMARLPPTRYHDDHPAICVFDHLGVACHGFSVLVEGRRRDRSACVLFDVGPRAEVWLDNAERIGVDLSTIEAVFLSHWHADHSGALPGVVAAIARARAAAGRAAPVVDVHPDRPDQRGIRMPSGAFALLPPEPRFDEIEAAGGRVAPHAHAHLVADMFAASGRIDRVTTYETGLVGHHSFVGDEVTSDPLILDERFLAVPVGGRGVSVLTACSHAGVVNACLGAMGMAPGAPVDLVLGGYHLAGAAMEARIPETVRDLAALVAPRIVAPGHCTGWRAKAALAGAFAPGRYGPSVVGSRYHLEAR